MTEKWSDEILIVTVKDSLSKSEVLKKLDLNTRNSGNFQTLNKHISRLGLDISHFITNKRYKQAFKTRNLEDILIQNSDYINTQNIKKRLLKANLLINKCYNDKCGITSWLGNHLSLHLDHINGVNNDNRLNNLRLLCPNCHSQTETYCRGTRRKKITLCCDCNSPISKNYKYCIKCSAIHRQKKYKIPWPPIDEVVRLVSKLGYSATGKLLKVSDNSIRKYVQQNADNKTFSSLRKRKPRKTKYTP